MPASASLPPGLEDPCFPFGMPTLLKVSPCSGVEAGPCLGSFLEGWGGDTGVQSQRCEDWGHASLIRKVGGQSWIHLSLSLIGSWALLAPKSH